MNILKPDDLGAYLQAAEKHNILQTKSPAFCDSYFKKKTTLVD